jgi:hypothetical protein
MIRLDAVELIELPAASRPEKLAWTSGDHRTLENVKATSRNGGTISATPNENGENRRIF